MAGARLSLIAVSVITVQHEVSRARWEFDSHPGHRGFRMAAHRWWDDSDVVDLPDGVVTFLFTDVEGSTRMWEESPDLMMRALEQHDEVIDQAVDAHAGVSVKPRGEGDSRFIVFADADDAVRAIADIQAGLGSVDWVTPRPLVVRASLHTGMADLQLGDYYGSVVNRAARLRAIAHGGQTVLSRSTWELVRDRLPDGVTVRDMGEHRLKDLTLPEHVHQLTVAGLRDDFPALASIGGVPNNLPIQPTDFVGRQAELTEAERLFTQTRLLTIMAPGGSGKTRLGIQVAADLTSDFPDGAFFIALADVGSSRDVVQAVAESLGLALSSDEDMQTQLLAYLTSKRQLLVFDNFEHVIDAAALVTAILGSAPQLKVLVTSRAKLNVTGETVFTLGGLETSWRSPEEALQASGVQLFIDAAKRARPRFELEPEDLASLAKILEMTDGLPLGILLAAAWVDMLPIGEIASEIAKNLDFLETEMGDVPERQRSIRAVFDYSWALLGPQERGIFQALSRFRGGFTREAAQAVAGASLRNLASLVNKSLLASSPETGRYAVHELLRQYAEAELKTDAALCEEVDEAYAAFYASLMDESAALFVRSDQPTAFAIVEHDIDNVRSAWRYCLAVGDAPAARRFVEGLWYLYEMRGWYPAGMSLFGEALDALDAGSDDEHVIKVRILSAAVQSWFQALVGQPEAGVGAAQVAVDILREAGDLVGYLTAAQCLAISFAYMGRMQEMAACTEEAITAAEAQQDEFWSAGMRNWRSFGAVLDGDLGTAEWLIPQAFEVFERRGEHFFMCWNLWLQAMIATQQARPLEAIDLHTRQVANCREIGYMRGTMVALEGLGEANVAAGMFDAAEKAFVDGIATADKMGMVRDMLGMMVKIAKVRAAVERSSEAVEMLSTVCAEPRSALQPFTANTPIRAMADAALNDCRTALGPEEYAEAMARGASTPFEVAVKELMGSDIPPTVQRD
ncbi:MAG: NB-ARC domain-containing protein [Nocardioidaceae bacterium]